MFIQTLVRRYPKEKFYISGNPRNLKFLNENNVTFSSKIMYTIQVIRAKIFKQSIGVVRSISKEKEAKAIIRIGGSIFMEVDGWKRRRTPRKNKNLFIIGANYGPAYSNDFFDSIFNEIKMAKDCCFRDSTSYKTFSKLGNVRLAPDVLFGYKYYPIPFKGDNIGISVIDLSCRNKLCAYQKEYEMLITELIRLYNLANKKVILYSFCNVEGDKDAINRIIKSLQFEANLEIIEYNGDISYILNSINTCECVFASRFHAMIIGWSMGKRVLPIIYSKKQTNVIQDINYSGYCWDLLSKEKVTANTLIKGMKEAPFFDCSLLKKNSEKQFFALDEFVRAHE